MHKKKNNSVLAGEMILTFCKNGQAAQTNGGAFNLSSTLEEILDHAPQEHIFGEYVFNKLVIEAWQHSALESLNIAREEFIEMLAKCGWHYDKTRHHWVKEQRQPARLFN